MSTASTPSLPIPVVARPRITRRREVNPARLSAVERDRLVDALYASHARIFDGLDRARFRRYVVDAPALWTRIQIYEDRGRVVGYTAVHLYDAVADGRRVLVLRSECGLERPYRGATAPGAFIVRSALVARLRSRCPVWFLGCLVHPSSYRVVARHAAELWPRADAPIPSDRARLMTALAERFGLCAVGPERPLVREVGWITRDTEQERARWAARTDAHTRFFLEANPGYVRGQGLLTLAPVSVGKILRGGISLLGRRLRRRLVC